MSSSTAATDQSTLSVPSLIVFAVFSFFAIRYFFFNPNVPVSPAAASIGSSGGPGTSQQRQNQQRQRQLASPEKVQTILSMFPQLTARDVEWDLVRNGGSVQATTEKVLREGRLPAPPPNFVSQMPVVGAGGSGANEERQRVQTNAAKFPDLITRYNLSTKVAVSPEEDGADQEVMQSGSKQLAKGGWSNDKQKRQELMRRRREEMILAARRKLEEKDKAGTTQSSGS